MKWKVLGQAEVEKTRTTIILRKLINDKSVTIQKGGSGYGSGRWRKVDHVSP